MKAPIAKKINHILKTHGHERTDPYYWMRDRENPEVINYLKEENSYLKEVLKETEGLQNQLFQEMKSRIKEDDQSVPYFKKGYFWYSRYEQGCEYPIYCRKKGSLEAKEEILLNVNELAEGKPYCQVSGLAVSHNQRYLGYGLDVVGRRIYEVFFKDLETGETSSLTIPNTTGNITWAADDQHLFYAKQDPETLRAHKIFRHELYSNSENDQLIFEEKDEEFSCHVLKTKSEAFLLIHSESTISSEIRFVDASQPLGDWKVLQARIPHLEYAADHYEDHFWIRTNHQAQNFKVVKAPVDNPGLQNWKDFIPHREDVLIEDFDLFLGFFVSQERSNGLTQLLIKPWDGSPGHALDFGEEAYTAWIGHNPEFDSEILRFGFNSLVTPASIFDYHMVTREKKLLKQQEVVGGYDSTLYESARIWAQAEDGVMVPISLVYKKSSFQPDGSNPLLLYAYGSYGYSSDAYFSSNRLSLLDRGFVFAIAHVRGGEDLGRKWYEDGKLLKKRNTFTDFIACAKHLIDENYTRVDRLYGMGGSAGGLLIGAVINMRPDLFDGVIAAVPFVDVVTTMLDESIPLTTGEFQEWGNPKFEEYYHYMLSYSPYDQVESKAYPNIMVTSGLHDSQVQYWEPTKWVAKLRDLKTDENLLLLHTNMEAGHGGASGRFQALKELAMEYAFLVMLADKKRK
ncbi:S9 family peptidase [Algoriphagus formosus]|uniref:Proline-specific endopeptidase n=1 Tax=Algoriphagus formosus TaxID=2007308 RepID=A0A4R5UU00_9BACT|nr:S9 family peptidase [Algoriphagus aquimaris]TDK42660.1 S9 family peptidase [Algoriphagus aquimaris]